jgi:cytochrome P450
MSHDEAVYKDADNFWPEKFTDSNSQGDLDPYNFVFGLGRRCVRIFVGRLDTQRLCLSSSRICSGMHFADSMMFIAFASVLSIFNISSEVDSDGRKIALELRWTTGPVR